MGSVSDKNEAQLNGLTESEEGSFYVSSSMKCCELLNVKVSVDNPLLEVRVGSTVPAVVLIENTDLIENVVVKDKEETLCLDNLTKNNISETTTGPTMQRERNAGPPGNIRERGANPHHQRPQVQTTMDEWMGRDGGRVDVNDAIGSTEQLVLDPWGDSLPQIQEDKVLRLVYQNVAYSLHTSPDDPGMAYFTENLIEIQCGMMLCTETNVNWRHPQNVYKVKQQLQKSFRVHGSVSSSEMGELPELRRRMRLPGGSAVFTFDHWAATVVDHGIDPYNCGWWSYTTLQGKNKQFFTGISYYRNCKANSSVGALTAHAQALHVLAKRQINGELSLDDIVVPREESVKCLLDFILTLKQRGHAIFLGCDGNETPTECITTKGPKKFSMAWLFEEAGLQEATIQRHGERPDTTTTTAGRHIDWIGVWNVPILRVARLGENYPGMSDHLGFAVDIDMLTLFGGPHSRLVTQVPRKLSVKNAKARGNFEADLLRQWNTHNLFNRAADFLWKARQGGFKMKDTYALNKFDTQLAEIILGAENRCSKRVVTRSPWSPALRDCGRIITYWRARLGALGERFSTPRRLAQLRRQAGIPWSLHKKTHSRKEIKAQLRVAWKVHRECKADAETVRATHLQERVIDLATRMQTSESKAAEMIANHEASRAQFRRIRRVMGKTKKGLTAITVDDPKSGGQILLTEKDAIHDALLARNPPHLQEPNLTKFGSLGSLFHLVDPDNSEGNQVDALLEGRAQLPPDDASDPELAEWLQELERRNFDELDLSVRPSDFVRLFENMKESTASSPSGLHVGIYITIAKMENSIIRDTLCMLYEAALLSGCPLLRWMNCTQVMLEKGKGNYINNLRIIQLLEADLNFVLRLIWGRRLNRAASNKGIYDVSQYAVPGSLCNSAALQKVLYLDLMRQCQETGYMTDFDAKATYDSVIPALAVVTCRRLGLPKAAGQFMVTLVNSMEYRVCTGHGVSAKSYSASDNPFLPCQGSFQGAGSSPMLYQSTSDVSLTAYRKNSTGAVFYHPNPEEAEVILYASQFVDDNTQQNNVEGLSHRLPKPVEEYAVEEREQMILAATNENAKKWIKYTSYGGGLINKSKSFVYFIKPVQDPDTGAYEYAKQADSPGKITLPDHDDEEFVVEAVQYEADVAQRTLGLMIAPDGNVKAEIQKQQTRARQWAISFARSDLSNRDRWVGYNSCVKPALLYPLMGQQIDGEVLPEVQIQVDNMVSHAAGLNSHFPKALLYGPMELGGMGAPPLWAEALADKLTYFLYHMRGSGTVTQELRASVGLVQLEVGSGVNFFELSFEEWGLLATPCWVSNLWKLCSRVGIKLKAAEAAHWVPPLQSTGDMYIMDVVLSTMPRKQWIKLNYCRRYLQLVTVADLFLHDGSRIHPDIIRCKRPSGRLANYIWPDLKEPTKACKEVWKAFVAKCCSQYIDIIANDDWNELPKYAYDLAFRYNTTTKTVYQYVYGEGWYEHEAIPGTRTLRGIYSKCSEEAVGLSREYPADTECVEVELAQDAILVVAVSHRHLSAGRYRQQEAERASAEPPIMLSERFAALPVELQKICGRVDIPEDGGAALAKYVMATGNKLYGVSDGSAKAGLGTHGWRLCRFPGDELALQGSGYVAGDSATSFRAESQGQLAILIASTVLAQRWCFSMLEVLAICDNKGVLKRLAKAHRDAKLADHKESDSDLYAVYREWARNAPVACTYRWVKGHQDRDTPVMDLPLDAQINCEVDALAGAVYDRKDAGKPDSDIPVFKEEVYGVYTHTGKFSGRLKRGVLAQCGREELEAYHAGKHKLGEGKRAGVNWEGLRSMLQSKPLHLRATYVKYQNGWLPTKGFLYKQGREASGVCPLCNAMDETIEHLHRCGSPGAVSFRETKLKECMDGLRAAGTAPEIVNCWSQQLSEMFGLQAPRARIMFACKKTEMIEQAVEIARKHQAILSWQGFLQGRHSVHWAKVQHLHERLRREKRRRGLPWLQKSVRLIGELGPSLWRYRNEQVHGATVAEEQLKRRQVIEARVKALYERNPTLLPRFSKVRSVPLCDRLKAPVGLLQAWLQQVERQEVVTNLVICRRTMKKGAILQYLAPKANAAGCGVGVEGRTVVFDRGKQ